MVDADLETEDSAQAGVLRRLTHRFRLGVDGKPEGPSLCGEVASPAGLTDLGPQEAPTCGACWWKAKLEAWRGCR